MSKALEVAYASAPANDVILHTLELSAASFAVQGHAPGVIRWVQGYDDIIAGLETGTQANFVAFGFGVSLPKKSSTGQQELQFQLDNVSGEASQAIDAAIENGDLIKVTYRAYLASDLSAPAQAPIVMTATSAKINALSVVVVASFFNLVNKAWPPRRYTPTFAPGLKYWG